MTPLEQKFRGGGLIGRTIRGRGMDIFWNHAFVFFLNWLHQLRTVPTNGKYFFPDNDCGG